jgi:trimethylamine corrinoid protein
MFDDLVNAIADLKETEALDMVRARLQAEADPLSILADTRKATEVVGRRFAAGEYYIPDLIYSGQILKGITALVKPKLVRAESKTMGKVVIGTVVGDIHNIGKDIVVFMLAANGFEVFDLGVDVPPEKFVQKIRETGAPVVGISGLLTMVYDAMRQTVEAIHAAGLPNQVKIMIGGGMINEEVRRYTGADAFGGDAMDGVTLAKKWSGGA